MDVTQVIMDILEQLAFDIIIENNEAFEALKDM